MTNQRAMMIRTVTAVLLMQEVVIVGAFTAPMISVRRSPVAPIVSSPPPSPTHPSETAQSAVSSNLLLLQARNRRYEDDYDDDEDDWDDDYYYDDDDYVDEAPRNSRNRLPRDDLSEYETGRQDRGLDVPSGFGRRKGWRLPESVSKALLAGIFVLGVGLGVTVDSAINTNPRDLASRDAIDQAAPNSQLCAKFGASAMAFDQRVFVSFNPFNVYVAQADVKPACVLRDANVVPILKDSKLINDDEVRACKRNMNTWAFVGDLKDTPQLSCVYRSADAQNEFLSDPKVGIGEDYLDDDREKLKSTGKMVKDNLSQAQRDSILKAHQQAAVEAAASSGVAAAVAR